MSARCAAHQSMTGPVPTCPGCIALLREEAIGARLAAFERLLAVAGQIVDDLKLTENTQAEAGRALALAVRECRQGENG